MKSIKLLIFLTLIIINCNAQNKKSDLKHHELNFIDIFVSDSLPGNSCYRIPALITAPNGNIIAAIDERIGSCADLRDGRDINISIKISKDNGQTWSETKSIVDFPLGKSASDPSFILDKTTNEIFLFYNFMDLDKEKNIYYLHYVKSKDNGLTWSKSIDITKQITKPEWKNDFKFVTSGKGTQTKDGTLLHTLVNLHRGLYIFGSNDHGESWFFVDNPIKPADESKIIELSDKTWFINSRVNKLGYRYIHKSKDKGKTWESSIDSTLIDPGCNGSIINYPSKKQDSILISSNPNDSVQRKNLTVKVSLNGGKSWSNEKVIYKGSSAYSSLTILKNGEIGILFERDEYTKNTFTKFSLDWLLEN
ncbi:MAG: sialidase [Ignavibacteriae bacterium]|nr:MAG: sialidase [Ignavibacteriota bacterium]